MSRFYGKVGYADEVETMPGVFENKMIIHYYRGEVMSNFRRLSNGDSINDNVEINNKFSIIADPYACQNFHNIRYIEHMGVKWKVTNVEVQHPRLILTAGGVYNG